MSTLFAVRGPISGELLSYRGRVLVDEDRRALCWLLPGCSVVPMPVEALRSRPTMPAREHPDLKNNWPTRKELNDGYLGR